jgi:hypothetical protein
MQIRFSGPDALFRFADRALNALLKNLPESWRQAKKNIYRLPS